MNSSEALIFDIYRGTSHDGPGQRNTVFFKGCPLSCAWCHNPEGISANRLVWWQSRQCIGCGMCHEACTTGANVMTEDGIHIDRNLCIACGKCAEACPAEAMTMCGEVWQLDKLVKEVLKNKAYYDRTGGGVTASGGETMLQYKFVAEFFRELHKNNVTTALDTCGFIPSEHYDEVLPYTDYVLYDLKIADPDEHKKFCGVGNELILQNAKKIVSEIAAGKVNAEFWIRTPLIPDATAKTENLKAIASFVVNELGAENITKWELCSFNNSCISKYQRLDKAWSFENKKLLRRDEVNELRQSIIDAGFPEDKLFATGIIAE